MYHMSCVCRGLMGPQNMCSYRGLDDRQLQESPADMGVGVGEAMLLGQLSTKLYLSLDESTKQINVLHLCLCGS